MDHCKLKRLSVAVANAIRCSSKHCHAVVLLSAASLAFPVMAETGNNSDSSMATQEEVPVGTLQGVMVTANKRDEEAKDVPMSISAVRSDTLIQEGTPTIETFYTKVPGLSLSSSPGGRTEVAMRGVTTGAAAAGNPVVGFTIDDAPFGGSTFVGGSSVLVPNIDPFDLDHIEVLRGPQGTLYGASSLGGLIKYVTVKPDTNKFSGQLQIDGSMVDHGGTGYGARGAVNLPIISNTFALRLSAFDREDPGWVDDPRLGKTNVNATRTTGGRISSLWFLNDEITVRTSYLQQHTDAYAGAGIDRTSAYGSWVDGDNDHRRVDEADGYSRTIRFLDTNVEADLGWATLTSVSAYSEIRNKIGQDLSSSFGYLITRQVPVLGAALGYDPSTMGMRSETPTSVNKFSQELRLDSPQDGRAFDWRTGLFFTRELVSTGQDVYIADIQTGVNLGRPSLYDLGSELDYRETGAYAMGTYHFTERFQLQAGVRAAHNKQRFTDSTGGLLNGATATTFSKSQETGYTFMVSPSYKITEDLMVYGRVATGYRPGGPNPSSNVSSSIPSSYDSDTTTNYELGLKGEFFDKTLSLETALFYIDWKDVQTTLTDSASSFNYMANGGKARSQGIENSFTWLPTDRLTINGTLTYTDARFVEADPRNPVVQNGDRLPYSPRWSSSLSATQEFPILGAYTGYAGATVTYMGDRGGSFPNRATSTRFTLPSYTTVDLKGGIRAGDWDASLYVRNLFNRDSLVGTGGRNTFATDNDVFTDTRLQPRTVGVSLSTHF
ncbi:TonB-dependent receptor [Pseudomonas putida]|uniref:TonB-dependent receptor n=1 Tax=Pseudomonas putida TaxID=303 RepID=UPI0009A1F39F|nr:TonB-dependent receptor [Pseudomonas putida]